jgi:hypothetical protein
MLLRELYNVAGLYSGITLADRNVILLVADSVSNLVRAEFSVRFKLALSTTLTRKMRLRLFNERGVPKYFLVRNTG